MDTNDFPMPSPKRRRSSSPSNPMVSKEEQVPLSFPQPDAQSKDATVAAEENNDILDALMQHVESESTPQQTSAMVAQYQEESENIEPMNVQTTAVADPSTTSMTAESGDQDVTVNSHSDVQLPKTNTSATGSELPVPPLPAITHPDSVVTNVTQFQTSIDAIPADDSVEQVAGAEGAEWEIDSSPYESSSDSDSSDETSSDDSDEDEDEDVDGDYAMLDAEEQARILMHGDAGSDDEGGAGKHKAEGAGYKTANEQLEDVPVIPDVTITEDMKLEELGLVEAVVENNVLVRAKVSGEYQVLESGSLLCLADRKVAGVVAETLGRVEQPLYTMRFKSEQDIQDRGLGKGTTIFYVQSHSSFVFTQPLKAVKGSDASNIHDEEVGADEMEFSDDEAEAEHKRLLKLKRQGRLGEAGRGRGSGRGRGGRGGGSSNGNHKGSFAPTTNTNGAAYGNGSLEMNYDDVEEGEEGYTPLRRPSNLHEPAKAPDNTAGESISHMPPPPSWGRERGGRGRGGHERGRGGRNAFRGRGAFQHQQQHVQRNQLPQPNQYHHTGFPNPALSSHFPPPPPPPLLAPQNPSYPGNMATSPMSPLPQQQFNFTNAFQPPQFGGYQQQQQQQQQQQYYPQQNTSFNPAAMQQFMMQQQQQQQQPQQVPQWQPNQAALAQVQKQLEEMRKAASQNQQ